VTADRPLPCECLERPSGSRPRSLTVQTRTNVEPRLRYCLRAEFSGLTLGALMSAEFSAGGLSSNYDALLKE